MQEPAHPVAQLTGLFHQAHGSEAVPTGYHFQLGTTLLKSAQWLPNGLVHQRGAIGATTKRKTLVLKEGYMSGGGG